MVLLLLQGRHSADGRKDSTKVGRFAESMKNGSQESCAGSQLGQSLKATVRQEVENKNPVGHLGV